VVTLAIKTEKASASDIEDTPEDVKNGMIDIE
jgi:hypothetical protein